MTATSDLIYISEGKRPDTLLSVTDFHENWQGHYAIRSHPNFTVPFPTIINNNKMAGAQICEMAEKPVPFYLR